ncbi:hypothetical protein [Metaclostridioides mangenotii]|nr:hypothetical protein [Clostridioides mangenotii]
MLRSKNENFNFIHTGYSDMMLKNILYKEIGDSKLKEMPAEEIK